MNKNTNRLVLLLALFAGLALTACTRSKTPMVETMVISEGWEFGGTGSEDWHPARVPGTVHTDLQRNGLIPDPFYGCNEKDLQWVGQRDWVYRTRFDVPRSMLGKKKVFLEFGGLDTYARVLLNGEPLLEANNMFRTWEADATRLLKPSGNLLEVYFDSAEKRFRSDSIASPYPLPGGQWVYARKAAYHFGWDWGPRFITAGIWKPVKLVGWETHKPEDIHLVTTVITPGSASIRANLQFRSADSGPVTLTISDSKSRRRLARETLMLSPGVSEHTAEFEIADPVLWWSNGLGEPHLYELDFELVTGDGLRHTRRIPYGIRTIEVVTEPDVHGESFYFRLNGVPVFMKGANYIPQHSFVTEITEKDYESLIERAAASNLNMLRVWGGGIYEQDLFYALCDRNGILVWQDFMFACAMYPGDEGFVENVRQEALEQVRRLRNHASLAIWCGNNEVDEGWHNWGWQRAHGISPEDSAAIWKAYQRVFHELLPGIVSEHDPQRHYLHTSPVHGWGRPESLQQGPSHYWGVWWGREPFEMYKEKIPRFMSEYGFQAMPALSAIRAFQDPESDFLFSPTLQCHQKHPTGYGTIDVYLEREFLAPADLIDYIYLSQLLQANGVGMAIQAHRRSMPRCMGSLYWQFNDCWPVASWSGTDVFGNWKALQYRVRELYDDIMVSLSRQNGIVEVHLVSDRPGETPGQFTLDLISFEGDTTQVVQEFFTTLPLSAITLLSIPEEWALAGKDPATHWLEGRFITTDNRVYRTGKFMAPTGKLHLPETSLELRTEAAEDGYLIHVTASAFAGHVQLYFTDSHAWFEDNFFHLWPGETRTVFCRSGLMHETFTEQLRVHHLGKALQGSLLR
jgi:beta-mannosidase